MKSLAGFLMTLVIAAPLVAFLETPWWATFSIAALVSMNVQIWVATRGKK